VTLKEPTALEITKRGNILLLSTKDIVLHRGGSFVIKRFILTIGV